MSEYGVGVLANRFALVDLEDEEDPFEILKRRQKEKEANKKKVDSAEKEKKAAPAAVNGSVTKKKANVKESGKSQDNGRAKQQERKSVSEATERAPRRHAEEPSEAMDDGFEQQRNGSFRSNRRGEGASQREGGYQRGEGGFQRREGGYQRGEGGYQRGEGGYQRGEGGYQRGEGGYQRGEGGYQRGEGGYQKSEDGGNDGRPPRGRVFGRGRGGVNRGEGGFQGRPRPSYEDRRNKSPSGAGSPEETMGDRPDDGFSRPERRGRFANGEGARAGGRGRGRGRGGYQARNGYQGNNPTGRSRSASEGEGEKTDEFNDWTTPPSAEGDNTGEKKEETGQEHEGEEGAAVDGAAESAAQELTLDEWKALKKRDGPTYNVRKAGEGEDLSKWKDMVKLDKKKAEVEGEEESDGEYELLEYPQRVGRQKYIKDLDFKFSDRRRGGGPGGRGRGGRPRNERVFNNQLQEEAVEPRRGYQASKQAPPKVDDERDFPSLG